MAVFNKFQCFVEDLAEKVHNLGSDNLKIMLSDTAPVVTNTVKVDITEISGVNGYPPGGITLPSVTSAQTSGTYKLAGGDVVFTAAGGSFGPARYAILYNDTSTNDSLIGWWDYGSSVTVAAGETFTVDLDQAAGILTIA